MVMDIDEVVFIVEEDKEDGGYSAVCHRYGIFTQGEDLDDLRKMVTDAVECRFEGESARPRQIRLHFVRDEVIAA
jgi:predicted RNase H-like HicB family nuclease